MDDGSSIFNQADFYKAELDGLDKKYELQTIKNDIAALRAILQVFVEKTEKDMEKIFKKLEEAEKDIEKIKDQGGHNYGKGSNDRVGR